MVVIGNPPYSVSSTNKSKWIEGLTADYKKDMKERNIQPLSDDYIKFIRFGQHFIDKNGEGVLAYISNNSFIDGIIHRQMRKHLLESFDKIYILDLHGNAKKKEVCPDGSPDQNVFDIMQGVSINIFVKTGVKKEKELAKVFHYDLQGKREFKYDFLSENSLKSFAWNELEYTSPNYFLVLKDFNEKEKYEKGFNVSELFPLNNIGIVTARDNFTLKNSKIEIQKTIEDFLTLDIETARTKFNLGKDSRDWQVSFALNDLQKHYPDKGKFIKINYRPFEYKWTYYTGKSKGFHSYPRNEVMQHFLKGENVGLIVSKQFGGGSHFICFLTTLINEKSSQPFAPFYNHPLYIYPENNGQQTLDISTPRTPNLNPTIVKQIEEGLGLTFTNEKETENDVCFANNDEVRPEFKQSFAPIDLLDYIYAVLHSPSYREKYKEFLKIDFPRIPPPVDPGKFWQLVKLGGELRQIHLLESPTVSNYITQYPEDGDNIVTKPIYKNGNVYINENQYFANVPEVAWDFYIGGYQPAQKWLKDRKERELSYEDILHYQKIIVAMSETDRIMKEIDKIEI
ncbi:type ISP restriction/modification enzyme [Flavobacterium soyangense]|uniref:type ISP restriction/modification enzyme n=1 Tax=Flavobacterium soyangense TaxID=2023265 RepID=UPI001E5ADD59|nr:type ISP restriction/modification enzyme [Flavobacterium soyangense]